MGLIKVVKSELEENDQYSIFLHYIISHPSTNNTTIAMKIVETTLKPTLKEVLIDESSSSIKTWAKNMKTSPITYLHQLQNCLESNSLEQCDETKKKNVFELDNEDNLIWKQFFPDQKIYGRKGKFTLQNVEEKCVLNHILELLFDDIKAKESSILQLKQDCLNLKEEKKELQEIAENSILMKDNFEKSIYKKFSLVLNSHKNSARNPLPVPVSESNDDEVDIEDRASPEVLDISQSNDEYEVSTDSDEEDLQGKRRQPSESTKAVKKLKSQDYLNDSLEMEMQSVNRS